MWRTQQSTATFHAAIPIIYQSSALLDEIFPVVEFEIHVIRNQNSKRAAQNSKAYRRNKNPAE